MFKNVSYNQLKKIRFITFIIAVLIYTVYLLFIDYVPETLRIVIVFFPLVGSILIIFSVILFSNKTATSKKAIQDEASISNDKDANTNTFFFVHGVICILIAITIFTDITITIDRNVAFLFFAVLQIVNDGCYLYLERRDMKYAGTDNED